MIHVAGAEAVPCQLFRARRVLAGSAEPPPLVAHKNIGRGVLGVGGQVQELRLRHPAVPDNGMLWKLSAAGTSRVVTLVAYRHVGVSIPLEPMSYGHRREVADGLPYFTVAAA